ncbi:MAG: response regulator transcription factor [Bacteroidota bacterium]
MRSVKTILADNHRIYIEGLKAVSAHHHHPDYSLQIFSTFHSGHRLIEALEQHRYDLLVMDLNLSDIDGLQVLDFIQKKKLDIKTIALTMYDDSKLVKSAFRRGLDGYCLKDKNISELFQCIQAVLKGESFLGEGIALGRTPNGNFRRKGGLQKAFFSDQFIKRHHLTKRELEILHLITQALSNKEIATQLFISDQTVSVHRKNIMRKLGVSNTAGLIKMAYDYSLV